jgi:RNA polymerase sigma factor (sigma-70 family)
MILSIDGAGEGEGAPPAPAASGASPSDEAAVREQKRRLAQALTTLPPRSAMIFTLFYQEEMSIAEIAQTVGMSAGAVKVALHRTREALKSRLKP